MIQHDQPTIFGDRLIVAVSSIDDGPMNFKGNDPEEIQSNRLAFLGMVKIDPLMTTLVQVTYEDTIDFARYKVVEDDQAGEGMLVFAAWRLYWSRDIRSCNSSFDAITLRQA